MSEPFLDWTTRSNLFSYINIIIFWFQIHCSLYSSAQLRKSQSWRIISHQKLTIYICVLLIEWFWSNVFSIANCADIVPYDLLINIQIYLERKQITEICIVIKSETAKFCHRNGAIGLMSLFVPCYLTRYKNFGGHGIQWLRNIVGCNYVSLP